jgi:hypothetical protein
MVIARIFTGIQCTVKAISPRAEVDLFEFHLPKGLRVVSRVKFTQESEYVFLTKI